MTNDVAIGYLLSLAEIAGVFIAFGVLIGALHKNVGTSSQRQASAAAACLIGTLTLLACLLPLLLQAFGVAQIWLYSSMAFLLLIGVGFIAANLNAGFRKSNPISFRRAPIVATIFWMGLELPIQAALLFNIFGVLPEYVIGFYFLAVIFNFGESCMFLLLMVFGGNGDA